MCEAWKDHVGWLLLSNMVLCPIKKEPGRLFRHHMSQRWDKRVSQIVDQTGVGHAKRRERREGKHTPFDTQT